MKYPHSFSTTTQLLFVILIHKLVFDVQIYAKCAEAYYTDCNFFYRAMHSAVLFRQIVCLSVMLSYRGQISWNTSKIMSRLVSVGFLLLLQTPTSRICSNSPKFCQEWNSGKLNNTRRRVVTYLVSHYDLLLCSECKFVK